MQIIKYHLPMFNISYKMFIPILLRFYSMLTSVIKVHFDIILLCNFREIFILSVQLTIL